MANSIYALSSTPTTAITTINDVLISRYGTGVTIHYFNTSTSYKYLIFTCPQISDKTIKLTFDNYSCLSVKYGDSYYSGTALINENYIGFTTATVNSPRTGQIVLGDSFILIILDGTGSHTVVIGKLTNGYSIAFSSQADSTKYLNHEAICTTVGKNVKVIECHSDFKTPSMSSNIQKIKFAFLKSNTAILNSDGTFATIEGLYCIGKINSGISSILGSNYLITTGYQYGNYETALFLEFPLYCEF